MTKNIKSPNLEDRAIFNRDTSTKKNSRFYSPHKGERPKFVTLADARRKDKLDKNRARMNRNELIRSNPTREGSIVSTTATNGRIYWFMIDQKGRKMRISAKLAESLKG